MRAAALHRCSHLVIRALIAAFTTLVVLLFQSAFWTDAVSAWMKFALASVALLSYFRPHVGLLLLAAALPLGRSITEVMPSEMRGAEGLVLAFLSGALVRGWTLHRFRQFPWSGFHFAALLFALAVAASWLEQLRLLQIRRGFPPGLPADFARYISREYITWIPELGGTADAMLLLGGVALMLYAAHYSQTRPPFAAGAVRMLVAGGLAAAVTNFVFMANEFLDTGRPVARLLEFLSSQRWSAHVGDVNAAGSFFAMTAFVAFGAAARGHDSPWRHRAGWTAAGALLAFAMLMTGSRTAVVAAALAAACLLAMLVLGRSIPPFGAAVVSVVAIALTGTVAVALFPAAFSGGSVETALAVRRIFLVTTWRMLGWAPLSGVGVGQYALMSNRFAPPELQDYYFRENAHNNFAQVAGELGLVGFLPFVAVLATALWMRSRHPRSPLAGPMTAGLAVFVLTWLGGHPLLVREVAYPFWMALGVLAGLTVAEQAFSRTFVTAAVASAIVLALTLPLRIQHKRSAFGGGSLVSGRSVIICPPHG